MKKVNKLHSNKQAKIAKPEKWKYLSAFFIIAILVFIAYAPALQNGFVWDDDGYIRINKSMQSFNLSGIFSEFIMGNYHPITILVYAIEYKFFGLNESGYHAINILIHILNTILVFYAVNLLSGKFQVALIASLLFGIHPIHVESVAWISELKDLLYTCFFLSAYIYYLKFLNTNQKKFYLFSLAFFLLSLLSKAMAASLPVLLILTDYFKERKINTKSLIEKIPFFALAIIIGIVAVFAQKESGATDISVFPFMQRIVFACYGFMAYLFKLFLPLQLCAYYAYPIKPGEDLPLQYYFYVPLFLALVAWVIYSLKFSRKFFLGLGFFSITIFLVLQLLPVGGVVIAERYSYVPSIGIFYLAGEGFYWLWSKTKSASDYKLPAIILLILAVIFFSFQTNARCGVWKNGILLWSDVISKFQNVPIVYLNRGVLYANENNPVSALSDYNKATELRPEDPEPYNNRGVLLMNSVKYEDALKEFNKAIQLNPKLPESYVNRGLVFMFMNNYNESRNNYNKAIEINPNHAEAYYHLGLLAEKENKTHQAFKNYSKAITLMSNYTNAYINRGALLYSEKKFENALIDYNKALEFEPENSQIYYNKGLVLMAEEKFDDAVSVFSKAIEFKNDFADAYYAKGLSQSYSGNKGLACQDFMQAIKMGHQQANDAYNQYCQ